MPAPGLQTTTLFSGYTVLCTAPDGIVVGGRHGLFYRDTRVLSAYRLTIGGKPPELVSAVQPESGRWNALLRVAREGGKPEGPALPQDALEVQVRRELGPGLVETIGLRNHSAIPCRTEVHIEIDADFADVAEIGEERRQQGTVSRVVDGERHRLEIRYAVEAGKRSDRRGLRVDVLDSSSPVAIDPTGIAFSVDLLAGGSWAARIRCSSLDGPTWAERSVAGPDGRTRQRAAWRRHRVAIDCADRLRGPFERAADDLFDLRNWELEEEILGRSDGARWILNAGIPMFTGLFGRDVITAGWQAAMLGPRALAGALDAVAALQASDDDPWRDAEPGKLIHERRSGPLAALGLTPRDAYYGSQTTPAMFVLALSELWHWTGDEAYLRRHIDVARRAMTWARVCGDLDGDGFLEYQKRSPQGLRNQAWKDSDEAIRHQDGSIVEGPVATVEEQAFYVLALERMAEILIALGFDEEAKANIRRASDLRRRFHEAFWMARKRFYAIALDGGKQQVQSIASNPGHALGAGVVPRELAETVADRLLARDLFAGWGVRSLSADHPSYNPFAYHLGCIWPVEQATFALGLKRYGLDRHLDRLVEGMFDAAFASPNGRLPEALAGHARDVALSPVPYPDANAPQAWSASALVQLVQIMLGIYPFAPLHVVLVVRPRLPAWAPDLTLTGLRVGRAAVDLRFGRRPDGSASWTVVRRRGRLTVLGAGPPDDVAPSGWLERLELAALDRAPGRLARAARIALGRT
jgi:glycogen debranching enzyme